MIRFFILIALFLSANAREQIRAVGSSTVYPFITVVAEEFGKSTNFKTPIIESTGTGGGFKLFCGGLGKNYPDMVNASRAVKQSEIEYCKQNGVEGLTEVKLGYDGIVLGNSVDGNNYDLSTKDLFFALARKIPSNGKLIDNNNIYWSDVNPDLPKIKIEVYGPPPTSGTRDSFVEIVLEKECKDLAEFKSAYSDKKYRKKMCHLIREDGVFIESGENDNLIIQKLSNNKDALGIFGYSFLEQNGEIVKGAKINGVSPEFETISDESYKISRPLFVYIKNQHVNIIPGIKGFITEMVSDNAAGDEGYLSYKGLIPLPENVRSKLKIDLNDLIG